MVHFAELLLHSPEYTIYYKGVLAAQQSVAAVMAAAGVWCPSVAVVKVAAGVWCLSVAVVVWP